MKLKRCLVAVLLVVLLFAVALLPALFRDASRVPLVGPDLSTFEYEEVEIDNGDLRLAGMLFVPEGAGPFPVAVIIHGSGGSRRNSTWYLSVTRHLQDNGVAVLLPDKRGCEKSQGSWVGADFHDLAGRHSGRGRLVRAPERFADSRVGVIGMSQGGWIAPVAAAEDDDMAFVVSMSGSTVTTDQQLLYEEIHNISEFTWPFIARLAGTHHHEKDPENGSLPAHLGLRPDPVLEEGRRADLHRFRGKRPERPVEDSVEALRANPIAARVEVYPDGGHAIRDTANERGPGRIPR